MALDPGTAKVGVAVSDELQFTIKPVKIIQRGSWKKLLSEIRELLAVYDAKALIMGLPLNTDGSESEMSQEARRMARNFSLSLEIPVVLHDERLTSYAARGRLWSTGAGERKVRQRLDSEAAAIILEDFIETRNHMLKEKGA
jgi:putative Holliday junction resolvase